jgi:hypothetical protein
MRLRMAQARSYDVAVDVRTTPAPPSQVISAEDPSQEPITVQCLVAARLVPVGDGISVTVPDEALEGGWAYQRFTELGVVEWAWSVSPTTPQDQQLRLELRPAAKGSDVIQISSATTARYVTEVEVSASKLQVVWYWFQTDWKLVATTVGIVGAAILALLQFSLSFRESVSKVFGRRRGSTVPAGAPPADSRPHRDDSGQRRPNKRRAGVRRR